MSSTPNPGSTQRFKDTVINRNMWSLPTTQQKENLKQAAKKAAIITVFAAVLNFASKKIIRKDMELVSTPIKGAEFFVAVGAGVLEHDALVEKKYI